MRLQSGRLRVEQNGTGHSQNLPDQSAERSQRIMAGQIQCSRQDRPAVASQQSGICRAITAAMSAAFICGAPGRAAFAPIAGRTRQPRDRRAHRRRSRTTGGCPGTHGAIAPAPAARNEGTLLLLDHGVENALEPGESGRLSKHRLRSAMRSTAPSRTVPGNAASIARTARPRAPVAGEPRHRRRTRECVPDGTRPRRSTFPCRSLR